MEAAMGLAQPCPRCFSTRRGSNERMKTLAEIEGAPYRGYFVQCFSCGERGPEGDPAEAASGWNALVAEPRHDPA